MVNAFLNIGHTEMMIVGAIFLSVLIAYIFLLFHAASNENLPGSHRILWFLIIFFLPMIGGIAYWLMVGKNGRLKSA